MSRKMGGFHNRGSHGRKHFGKKAQTRDGRNGTSLAYMGNFVRVAPGGSSKPVFIKQWVRRPPYSLFF